MRLGERGLRAVRERERGDLKNHDTRLVIHETYTVGPHINARMQ